MTTLIVARGESPLGEADVSDDVNLIFNGKLESALVGTQGWADGGVVAISRDTVAPIDGAGSLKVVTTGGFGGEGAGVAPITVETGATYRLSFAIKREAGGGSGNMIGYVDFSGAADIDPLFELTLTTEPQSVSAEFTIPSPAIACDIWWYTPWDDAQALTYVIDNAKFIKIANP